MTGLELLGVLSGTIVSGYLIDEHFSLRLNFHSDIVEALGEFFKILAQTAVDFVLSKIDVF